MKRRIDTGGRMPFFRLVFAFATIAGAEHVLANDLDITPKNETLTTIVAGESVFASCRQSNPVDTRCRIDCGNGQTIEKASGLCGYSQPGTYKLVVTMVERRKAHFHVATVSVVDPAKAVYLRRPTSSGAYRIASPAVGAPGAPAVVANNPNVTVTEQASFGAFSTSTINQTQSQQFTVSNTNSLSTSSTAVFNNTSSNNTNNTASSNNNEAFSNRLQQQNTFSGR